MKYTEPIQNQPPLPTGPDANGGKDMPQEHVQSKMPPKQFKMRKKKPARRARGMY